MKHIFIVNPIAGKKSVLPFIEEEIKKIEGIDWEIYVTKEKGDARNYCHNVLVRNPIDEFRFYACGGDGTANEVVNGIYGFPNAAFTVFPCGSGNDFVKATKGDFKDISKLINGEEKRIDLIRANGVFGINIINVGFDAAVAFNMTKFKRWPLISGKGAYNLALVKSLFSEMSHKGQIYADGELIFDGKFLMTSACNGICCGGAYYFAPNALIDDGLIDHLLIKKVNIFKFLSMVGNFKNGSYVNIPKYKKITMIERIKNLKIVSNKELKYGIDGETDRSKEIEIDLIPSAVRFFYPKDDSIDKSSSVM